MIKRCAILILAFWWAGSGAAWAERLAVDAPIANIRSGPGTEHAVVWKIERYHPLEIVEQRGSGADLRTLKMIRAGFTDPCFRKSTP